MRKVNLAVAGGTAVAIVAAVVWLSAPVPQGQAITIPSLSDAATRGQAAFAQYCAKCHGQDAGGTASGPPLIHAYYRPDHHGDMAFMMAARLGTRQHHWRFGDMPPVEGVSDAQVIDIIDFIREVQKANGLL